MASSRSPLPLLPLEVKHQILRLCDQQTLGRTAQVSRAFLELSTPLLYEDVFVQDQEQLDLLIRSKSLPASLQLEPRLSLFPTHTLNIFLPQLGLSVNIRPSAAEIQTSHLSALHQLVILLPQGKAVFPPSLHLALFRLNPVYLVVDFVGEKKPELKKLDKVAKTVEEINALVRSSRWPRLRDVTYDFSSLSSYLRLLPVFERVAADARSHLSNRGSKVFVVVRSEDDVKECWNTVRFLVSAEGRRRAESQRVVSVSAPDESRHVLPPLLRRSAYIPSYDPEPALPRQRASRHPSYINPWATGPTS